MTKTFEIFLKNPKKLPRNSFSVHTGVLLYNHSKGNDKKIPPKFFLKPFIVMLGKVHKTPKLVGFANHQIPFIIL